METKMYWCDPDDGRKSKFIKKIDNEYSEILDVKFEDGSEASVPQNEVIEVLIGGELALEQVINTPFDWDVYLHHIGGATFDFRGFTFSVMGEQSTFLNGIQFHENPQLLLEFKDELSYGDSCWIEIVEDSDFDREYPAVSSLREAVDYVLRLEKDRNKKEDKLTRYIVRLETKVIKSELGNIEVFAYSRDEALKNAIDLYESGNVEVDFWESDYKESELWLDTRFNWEIKKVKED